ncbi:hypothetical protein Q9L42_018870 [Methylomarinum sp. Ch1-1]|uniref:Uncharacterized protein n=1 Tax=Methylomarinum roseum TaxID=3067653 RepID=A0AAU7NTQ3_9GAMM|nr:hypothetical protein [Methylomarinum sp. Ch1-1]MDP4519551.1 hypothetical protein [Methylomarinum sp. Ch1-1]
MNRKLFLIVVSLLLGAVNPVYADKTLAHSKSLGMRFIAEGDPWCAATVKIRVQAEDAGQFAMPDYGLTIQKLGQVLMKQCSAMNGLSITGLEGSRVIWTGKASKAKGWIAQKTPLLEPLGVTNEAVSSNEQAGQLQNQENQMSSATEDERSAENFESVAADVMEIAGWRPGGFVDISSNADKMTELTSSETGCNIFTFYEVNPQFHPTASLKGDFTCKNGYVQSTDLIRQVHASLFYQGQKRPFIKLVGYWYDGYNIDRGNPKQIVRRYSVNSKNLWNKSNAVNKLLVWIGEDRELRAHYFVTYNYHDRSHQWNMVRGDRQPIIVLTDNEQLKQNPRETRLAESLARTYTEFVGSGSFNVLKFVVADKLQKAPLNAYHLALKDANPDPSLYAAGQAVKRRGIPWTIQVTTDFIAKREAYVEAEKKRAEMQRQRELARVEADKQRAELERQRQAALHQKHMESLQNQYKLLAKASGYDRMRFYATLRLNPKQLESAKIDFKSYRNYTVNPFSRSVQFTHPAMYLNRLNDGEVNVGIPIYMLVKADDGDIVKPYPMAIDYNDASAEIDGWMLIQAAPEFTFKFDDEGRPIFSITIQEAVECKSDKCLEDMDSAEIMKTWYNDDDLKFAMADEH